MRTILGTLAILAACATTTHASAAVVYEFEGKLRGADRLYVQLATPQFLAEAALLPSANVVLSLVTRTIGASGVRVAAGTPAQSLITITDFVANQAQTVTVPSACLGQSGLSFFCASKSSDDTALTRIAVDYLADGIVRYQIQKQQAGGNSYATVATIDTAGPLVLSATGNQIAPKFQLVDQPGTAAASYDTNSGVLSLDLGSAIGLFTFNLAIYDAVTDLSGLVGGRASYRSISQGLVNTSIFHDLTITGLPDPVAPPALAVPEPSTWAMLIAGVGVIGAGMRRRGGRLVAARA